MTIDYTVEDGKYQGTARALAFPAAQAGCGTFNPFYTYLPPSLQPHAPQQPPSYYNTFDSPDDARLQPNGWTPAVGHLHLNDLCAMSDLLLPGNCSYYPGYTQVVLNPRWAEATAAIDNWHALDVAMCPLCFNIPELGRGDPRYCDSAHRVGVWLGITSGSAENPQGLRDPVAYMVWRQKAGLGSGWADTYYAGNPTCPTPSSCQPVGTPTCQSGCHWSTEQNKCVCPPPDPGASGGSIWLLGGILAAGIVGAVIVAARPSHFSLGAQYQR